MGSGEWNMRGTGNFGKWKRGSCREGESGLELEKPSCFNIVDANAWCGTDHSWVHFKHFMKMV